MNKKRNYLHRESFVQGPQSMAELINMIARNYPKMGLTLVDEVKVEQIKDNRVRVTYTFSQVKKMLDAGKKV